jgi:ElaB/YqjD/DUF883 family membrane-anchored ribosome-binding protein
MENPSISGNSAGNTHTKPLVDGIDSARAEAHSAIDGISNVAHPAVDRLASNAHEVIDRLVSAANSAGDTYENQAAALGRMRDRVTGSTGEYIVRNPLSSIGMALAAGFLLSRLLRSR